MVSLERTQNLTLHYLSKLPFHFIKATQLKNSRSIKKIQVLDFQLNILQHDCMHTVIGHALKRERTVEKHMEMVLRKKGTPNSNHLAIH